MSAHRPWYAACRTGLRRSAVSQYRARAQRQVAPSFRWGDIPRIAVPHPRSKCGSLPSQSWPSGTGRIGKLAGGSSGLLRCRQWVQSRLQSGRDARVGHLPQWNGHHFKKWQQRNRFVQQQSGSSDSYLYASIGGQDSTSRDYARKKVQPVASPRRRHRGRTTHFVSVPIQVSASE
jgi:hypothetical protein